MKSFLDNARPVITVLLSSTDETGLLKEIRNSIEQGVDAFGLRIELLPQCLRTEEKLKSFFAAMQGKPIYITCYKRWDVIEETDEQRSEMLLNALKWGADMADIRGDMFSACDGEITYDNAAVKKQKKLIAQIRSMGKTVLMSSHIIFDDKFKFIPKEKVLKIALEHEKRGADIAKIVSNADTEGELLENFEAITLCKKKVKIPVLFLCNGEKCLRHRLACGLICEPMVFVKEKSYCPIDCPQPSIETMVEIFNNANMKKTNRSR